MNYSNVRLLLEWVLMLLFLEMAVVSAASLPVANGFNPELEESAPRQDMPERSLIQKARMQRELGKQLMILQAAEQNIVKHIQALEAERLALSQRKRSHFTSMCMFNVVACYRRRK